MASDGGNMVILPGYGIASIHSVKNQRIYKVEEVHAVALGSLSAHLIRKFALVLFDFKIAPFHLF